MEAERRGSDDALCANDETFARWQKRIEYYNKKVFKNKKLEPKELPSVLTSVLSRRDCVVGVDLPGKNALCYVLPAASETGVSVVLFPHKSEISPFQDNECSLNFVREQIDAYCGLGVPAAIWGDRDGNEKLLQDLTSQQPRTKLLYVLGLRCIQNASFLALIDKLHLSGTLQRFCLEKVEYYQDNWDAYELIQTLRKRKPSIPILAVVNVRNLEANGGEGFQEFSADLVENLDLGKNLICNTFEMLADGDTRKTSVDGEETLHTCDYCSHVGVKELRCPQCNEVYYCDKACQKAGWHRHKDQCGHYFA